MQIKNSVFLSLIGDYYLHTNVLKNQHVFVSNKTSLTIESLINDFSETIVGDLLQITHKPNIILGYYKIDKHSNISFFNMLGDRVFPKAIISPFSNTVEVNINEFVKKSTSYRIDKGIVYLIQDSSNLLLIDQELSKLSINDTIKAIIQKYIYMSPENSNTVEKLISVILGADVCHSFDGETILKIENNYILTDKNQYYIDFDNYIKPEIGKKIKYLDPVYLLCKSNSNLIKSNFIYADLIKTQTIDPYYGYLIKEAILGSTIFIKIPTEVFIANYEAAKNLSAIKNKFKTIFVQPTSVFEENKKISYRENSALYKQSLSKVEVVSKSKIITDYYKTSETLKTSHSYSLKMEEKGKFNYSLSENLSASKREAKTINISQKERTLKKEHVGINTLESNIKKATQYEFTLFQINEKEYFKQSNTDFFKLFKDQYQTIIYSKTTPTLHSPVEMLFLTQSVDNMFKQSDITNIVSRNNNNLYINEENKKAGSLIKNEKDYLPIDFVTSKSINESNISYADKLTKITTIDKNNFKLYNIDKLDIVKLEHNSISVSQLNNAKWLYKDLVNVKDKMLIETDTTIDKE